MKKREWITCKDIERQIPDFLSDEMEDGELDRFISHIDGCASCREELTIQFLVSTGMLRLEEGDNFNLTKELGDMLRTRKHGIETRRRLRNASYLLETVVAVLTAVTVYLGFVLL